MDDIISKTLSERSSFISHLTDDLAKNEQIKERKTTEIKKLDEVIETVKYLGAKPEHSSLIKLGKRIYIPGKIVHTGEYLCEKKSHPYPFNVLMTLEQTVKSLEAKKEEVDEDYKKLMELERQLEARLEILSLGNDSSEGTLDSIKSDKGVALKVGEFYEIIEFED